MPPRKLTVGLTLGWVGAAVIAALLTGSTNPAQAGPQAPVDTIVVERIAADSLPWPVSWNRDALAGRSGKLFMKLVAPDENDGIGVLSRLFGDSAGRLPGVYVAPDSSPVGAVSFVNLVPFSAKENGKLGPYRMGYWPGEQRRVSEAYGNPPGFIEVTPSNQDTRVSEHFRLRDFLTKDQTSVWPKYLVLQEGLLDKLELVIHALERRGVAVSRMSVMSGFRTPQYNDRGVGSGGRASNSRHQYGDAADVFVDNDGNGRMDDLNGDGRVNTGDARYLAQVVESVEADHPDLVGGVGVYAATSAHGPFVHVDVRGSRARW